MAIKKEFFGTTAGGGKTNLYTLTNANGLAAKITNYGGIITELYTPDRKGKLADIVAGYKTLDEYIKDTPYFGAIIGRYGNRIANGLFTLNGVEYKLEQNNGKNHLHGGLKGFDKVVWDAEEMQTEKDAALKLSYLSRDGEERYPGNLKCTVIFTLTNDNQLTISYEAATDKSTVVNLTHHSYFNLAGHNSGNILSHQLMINADRFTPVDDTLIPTGKLENVKGSVMDFTKPMPIGSRISQVAGGYDHNYVLNKKGNEMSLAASVYEPKTGRAMEISTTEPAVQLYSGNFLNGTHKGKGAVYNKHNAFCLETQHYPDSPNQPKFPSTVLEPGKKYTQLTVHKFSVR